MNNKKLVLITGHTSGIGKILTQKLLATKNFEIIAIARRKIEEHPLLNQISCDLSSYEEVKKLNHSLSKKKFDFLILNAGANNIKPAESYNIEEIQKIIQLNFTTHTLIFRMCINGLIKNKGHVIGIGSSSANEIKRWNNYYGSAKAAFHHFIKNMFEQYRQQHVKFSLIIPDVTDTQFYKHQEFIPEEGTNYRLSPDYICNFIVNQIINSNEFYPFETHFKVHLYKFKKIQ